jgi:hypothetical protein
MAGLYCLKSALGMIRRAAALAELAGAGNLLDVGSSA